MKKNLYTASKIAQITDGKLINSGDEDLVIRDLVIDSRHLLEPEESMFVALISTRNDGHRYIEDLSKRGVKCFLVSKLPDEGRGTKDEGRGSIHGNNMAIMCNSGN